MGAMKVLDLEWATASRPAVKGDELGDGALVRQLDHGVLIAVADGLGHGREAASATRLALRAVETSPHTTLERICHDCHQALHPTRGVVLGLAAVDSREGSLSWLGVGGVGAVILPGQPGASAPTHGLLTHRGVVGRQLPALRSLTRPFVAGDFLILTTDGIRSGFEPGALANEPLDGIAARILERHAVPGDDALVLVASYRGVAA